MGKKVDLLGKVFNHLTVLEKLPSVKGSLRGVIWRCQCSCGALKDLPACDLNNGKHQSCGCKRQEMLEAALVKGRVKALKSVITHGAFVDGKHPANYNSWHAMMNRCYNPKYHPTKFDNHGGRGITVCERWHDYKNFDADMGQPPAPDMSLERKDNQGNYEPNNCKWATRSAQGRNKRNNHLLTFNGETRCLAEWCEVLGMKFSTLTSRLAAGWSVESAFTTPIRNY